MFKRLKRRLLGPSRAELTQFGKWLSTGRTGMSSEALAIYLLTGHAGNPSYPHDNSDLGRCIKMLRYMGWETRICEATAMSPEWAALSAQWPELVRLYDAQIAEEQAAGGYIMRPRYLRANASAKAKAEYAEQMAAYEAAASSALYALMKSILNPIELKVRAEWKAAA